MSPSRRMLAIVMLVSMLVMASGIASANFPDVANTRFAAATDRLMRLGVLVGDPDGNFYPARGITRAEMVKIVISVRGLLHQVASLTGSPAFPDTSDHWASGFIALAKNLGIINGFPDGLFKPDDRVTYAQAAKMLLEATGNGPDAASAWPDNYMSVALAKGMFQDIPTTAANVLAIRGDCAMMAASTVDTITNPGTGRTLAQSIFGEVAVLELTPATTVYTPVGAAVQLTAQPKNAAGQTIVGLPVGWMTSDPTRSTLTQSGQFNSPIAGAYVISAAAGGYIKTANVTVFGTAVGLRATPLASEVTATGATKATITVEVIDAAGGRVANNNATVISMAHAENNGAVTLGTSTQTTRSGVAQFTVTSTSNEDRTDLIEFTAPNLTKDAVTISTVPQIATVIRVTAEPSAVLANSVTSSLVTAHILDQFGERMVQGALPVTFAISGPGSFAGGSRAPIATATSGGEASVLIYSEQAVPGTIRVTTTSPGLPDGLVSVTSYLAGTATGLKAEVKDGTVQACSTGSDADVAILTIALVDSSGRATIRTSPAAFALALANGAPLSSVGLSAVGDLVIDGGSVRTDTITIRAAAADQGVAGTHTVKVTPSDSSLTPTTFTIKVTAGEPAGLKLTPGEAISLPVTNPTVTVQVQVIDAAGNDCQIADLAIAVGWHDVGATNQGKLSINGVLNPPTDPTADAAVRATTDASGRATFLVAAQKYMNDDYQLHFTHDGVSATSGVLTVVDKVASQIELRFTDTSGAMITQLRADYSSTGIAEVTVKDGNGNPLGGWSVTLVFGNEGAHVLDVVPVLGSVVSAYADGEVTLRTVDDPGNPDHGKVSVSFGGAAASSGFAVTATAHGAPSPLTRTATLRVVKGSVVAGIEVTDQDGASTSSIAVTGNTPLTLRLAPVDNGGNRITAPVDIKVLVDQIEGLYSTGVAGEFRESASGTGLPAGSLITIARGQPEKLIYYIQPGGQDAIEIGIDNSSTAYTAYEFTAAALTYTAGPPASNLVTVTVLDASGNPAPGLRITFTTTAGALSAQSATTDLTGAATVTWSSGTGGQLTAKAVDAIMGNGATVEILIPWGTL